MIVDLPAPFATGQVLSGYLLNQLRAAAIQVDALSFRQHPAFDSLGGADTASVDLHTAGDYRLWWGALRYRTGMTSLVLEGISASYTSGTTIKLYINGGATAALTISAASTWTGTLDISTGYSDGDIILLEVRTSGNAIKTSKHLLTDMYATPVAMPDTWPGVPTFTTTYNASQLNQLVSALDWLYRRMDAVPFVPQVGQVYAPGTHKNLDLTLYSGTVGYYQTNDALRISGNAYILGNPQTGLRVTLNGSVVYNPTTWTVGTTQTFDVSIPLTYTLGTRAELRIEEDVTIGNPDTIINTRFDFTRIGTEANSSGYPVQTAPVVFPENDTIAQTTLTTRLNALASMISTTKTNIDNTGVLWNRIRPFRRRFAQDDHQNTKLNRRYPARAMRRGEKLIVRGKGVQMEWGAISVPSTEEDGPQYDKWEYSQKKSITDGDKIETKIVFFDEFPGIFQGVFYTLTGDIYYAEERLLP